MIKKRIDHTSLSLNSFIHRIKKFSLILVIFVVLFIYFIIYRPMYSNLKDSRLEVFDQISHLNYHTAETIITNSITSAKSLSSRSMIKTAIDDYFSGIINYKELQDFTLDKYSEGAKAIDNIILANRYVDKELLVSYNNSSYDLDLSSSLYIPESVSDIMTDIVTTDNYIIARIISPITSNDKILGYDLIIYDLTSILNELNDTDVSVTFSDYNSSSKLLEASEILIKTDEYILLQKDNYFYSSGYIKNNIYLITSQSQVSLFKPLMDHTMYMIVLGGVFFILFLIFSYMYIVRFINNSMEDLEDSRESYKKIAYIDFLTKAYSRTYLNIWNSTLRNSYSEYILIMIDLDKFKKINDKYGHKTGDDVLSKISSIIMNSIRNNDFLFRYGGDEFVLILSDISEELAIARLHDISAKAMNSTIIDEGISLSYGIYTLEPGKSLDLALNEADKNMYKNKKNGVQ